MSFRNGSSGKVEHCDLVGQMATGAVPGSPDYRPSRSCVFQFAVNPCQILFVSQDCCCELFLCAPLCSGRVFLPSPVAAVTGQESSH